jgi:hypothetical protein
MTIVADNTTSMAAVAISAVAASDPETFDIAAVVAMVIEEIERGEIASAEDYIEHRLAATGRRPPSRVESDGSYRMSPSISLTRRCAWRRLGRMDRL